ncbi:Tfp pilus assembly protein FimT/FimU [Acinetobacter sp. ULE_I010]|uniref:pilus assembly FimT family protein n=1 Tax=Acinetobacter sp. ULE_I010 TaxID=3373065 RepID=UPI003AF7EDB6
MRIKKGFTLIELMVTVSILVIIVMLAAPSFTNLLVKQNLNSNIRTLLATFSDARSQSILLRKDVTVILNNTNKNTEINYYWSMEGRGSLVAPTTIPSIVFQSDGTLKNTTKNTKFTDTNFIICSMNFSKTVTLTRVGTITLGAEGSC